MSETTVSDRLRRVFATFDAKDVSTLAGFMIDDVALSRFPAATCSGYETD
jgi:hypothetical protein